MANILQAPLLMNFLYPLLLVFFICFAILEKTKIFGDSKQQLNALVSLVIGLIFVSSVFSKLVVANLVQYLAVGAVIIFISLLLWGFVSGSETWGFPTTFKKPLAIILGIALFFILIAATGSGSGISNFLVKFFDLLFNSQWSSGFWTNFIIVVLVVIGIVVVIKGPNGGISSGESKA